MKREAFLEVHRYCNPAPVLVYKHTKETTRSVDAHWHDDLEINYLAGGRLRFYVGGQEKNFESGQICLINSGELHSSIPVLSGRDGISTGITLIIQHDFLTGMIPNYDSIMLRILGLVCGILSVLLDSCVVERGIVDIDYWKDSEQQKIILDYIHSHYDQPLRQRELAERFHFSKEYFCRFFKRYTGQTFKEYLTRYRLVYAEQMLRNSDSSIVEIAQRNGFPDEQSFIRAFKNQYQESPGKYRKALLER